MTLFKNKVKKLTLSQLKQTITKGYLFLFDRRLDSCVALIFGYVKPEEICPQYTETEYLTKFLINKTPNYYVFNK